MAQVSKYPVSKDVYERIFDLFIKAISDLGSRKDTSGFIQELLTPTEQVMITKRLAIAFLLAKKYEYREISKILRVSTSTVSRVAYSYKEGKYFSNSIDKILKDEKTEEFISGVGEAIAKLLAAGGSKSGSWRYLKDEIRKKKEKVF